MSLPRWGQRPRKPNRVGGGQTQIQAIRAFSRDCSAVPDQLRNEARTDRGQGWRVYLDGNRILPLPWI